MKKQKNKKVIEYHIFVYPETGEYDWYFEDQDFPGLSKQITKSLHTKSIEITDDIIDLLRLEK